MFESDWFLTITGLVFIAQFAIVEPKLSALA